MKILQLYLALCLFLICFSFFPSADGTIPSNLYSVRLPLIAIVISIGNLWILSIKSRSISTINWLKNNLKWPINPLIIPLSTYIAWIIISALLSPFAGYAFLGYPYLQFGGLMLIASIGLLFLYTNMTQTVLSVRSLSIITLVMCIFTILEAIGFHPLNLWIHSPRMVYPAALIGHRPHLGGWYAIMALAPLFFYRNTKYDAWFWIWIFSALIGLGLSTTSAASIGVGVSLLLWAILNARVINYRPAFFIFLIFSLSVTTLPSLSTSLGDRLGLSSGGFKDYFSTGSFKPRLYLWKAAAKASFERPVFGWGDETFGFEVFKHLSKNDGEKLLRAELSLSEETKISYSGTIYHTYDPKTRRSGSGDLIYIRAHSIVFDELYSRGFIGLFLLFLLAVNFLKYAHKLDVKSFSIFTITLLPYPIYLLAWFYVPTVTPLFFIVMGLMIADLRSSVSNPSGAE